MSVWMHKERRRTDGNDECKMHGDGISEGHQCLYVVGKSSRARGHFQAFMICEYCEEHSSDDEIADLFD